MNGFDRFEIAVSTSSRDENRIFQGGADGDFTLGVEALTERYGGVLPKRWYDLLRIAGAVYVADLAVRRDKSWGRSIGLSVPVLDYSFWSREDVYSSVDRLVSFLSGDAWSLGYSPGSGYPVENIQWQPYLSERLSHRGEVACLYSGGLDSAAGLAARLQEQAELRFAPVTVAHRSDIGSQSRGQLTELKRHYGGRLSPIVVPFEFRRSDRCRKRESSQRTRSFLFAAAGCVVAAINDTNTLEAYESGVGAINVPLLGSMRGSQATRGMHPRTVQLMSEVASLVFDQPFQVRLPFVYQSKAEVVRRLNNDGLARIALDTVSCVHYPQRHVAGMGHRQCGVCPACLFRRVALIAAGIEEPAGVYQTDLLDPSHQLESGKARPLIAFLNQVDAISAAGDVGLPPFIESHLRRTGVIANGHDVKVLADLFRRYAADWRAFIQQGRQNGCHWSNRIDARSAAA